MRRIARSVLLMVAMVMLIGGIGVGRLLLADVAATPSPAEQQSRDTLHYWSHLTLGRVFDLCTCTRGQARMQYARAGMHARSSDERALLTTRAPHGLRARFIDVVHLPVRLTRALYTDPLARDVMVVAVLALTIGTVGIAGLSAAISRASSGQHGS